MRERVVRLVINSSGKKRIYGEKENKTKKKNETINATACKRRVSKTQNIAKLS
jgi:hypothetical protein